jgi:hypothetical protein
MPVHDWTKVDSGLFHHFHQRWIGELCDALNEGKLPSDFFALVEQNIRGPIPDLLTLKLSPTELDTLPQDAGGVAVATARPQTRFTKRAEADSYVRKSDRITVRNRHGRVVAVVEIVSPGNKAGTAAFRDFIEKIADLVFQGIHVLVIDLFPTGPRDPQGIAKAIWDEFAEEDFEAVPDKPLTLAALDAGSTREIHVEPIAVGDVLTEMPLFLKPGAYIYAPLELSYNTTWKKFPAPMKKLLT